MIFSNLQLDVLIHSYLKKGIRFYYKISTQDYFSKFLIPRIIIILLNFTVTDYSTNI